MPHFYTGSRRSSGIPYTPIINDFLHNFAATHEEYLTMKKRNTKLNKRNSKILHETMVTLGALKESSDALQEMHINEMQVHILDEDGDGVVLCLEYDESSEELHKTFHTMEEYYTDENADEDETVPLSIGEIDACASPENVKEFLRARIEETISEEYDEIFHNSGDDDDPPPLLN